MSTHFGEQENFVRILELTPELRKRIEQTIEHLVSLLDDYDGDENAEDDGMAEPVNGWPNQRQFCGDHPLNNVMSCDDEREQDNADWEDGGDDEAWLGWTATGNMGMYADYDLEQNGDEDEPLCGWTEGLDQSRKDRTSDRGPQEWHHHYGFDRSGKYEAFRMISRRRGVPRVRRGSAPRMGIR
ncbi:hypothetical protein [Martelella sp. AMO21009]